MIQVQWEKEKNHHSIWDEYLLWIKWIQLAHFPKICLKSINQNFNVWLCRSILLFALLLNKGYSCFEHISIHILLHRFSHLNRKLVSIPWYKRTNSDIFHRWSFQYTDSYEYHSSKGTDCYTSLHLFRKPVDNKCHRYKNDLVEIVQNHCTKWNRMQLLWSI